MEREGIEFSRGTTVDGKLVVAHVTTMKYTDIRKCKFYILVPEHYRKDGSCKCDDAEHRKMMIREWGYTPKSFKGIPLRAKED